VSASTDIDMIPLDKLHPPIPDYFLVAAAAHFGTIPPLPLL
jgi:hypothetical protein